MPATQTILGTTQNLSSPSIYYLAIPCRVVQNTSEALDQNSIFPVAGTLKNLRVSFDVAPGGVASWKYTIRKNGVDSGITVTTTGAATYAEDTINTLAVAAGDKIALHVVPTGGPATTPWPKWCIDFESNTAETVIMGDPATRPTAGTTYYFPIACGTFGLIGSDDPVKCVMPTGGVLAHFYARNCDAPGVGNSYIFTIRLNGASPPGGIT